MARTTTREATTTFLGQDLDATEAAATASDVFHEAYSSCAAATVAWKLPGIYLSFADDLNAGTSNPFKAFVEYDRFSVISADSDTLTGDAALAETISGASADSTEITTYRHTATKTDDECCFLIHTIRADTISHVAATNKSDVGFTTASHWGVILTCPPDA